MANKEFLVRHGLIVGDNILVANVTSNTVTIGGKIEATTIQVGGSSIPSGATSNLVFDTVNAAFSVANSAYAAQNSDYTSSNAAYTVANSAYGSANTVGGYANTAGSLANQAGVIANSAFGLTNTTYAAVNSAFGVVNAAYTSSNADYVVTNSAFGVANAAFTQSNSEVTRLSAAYVVANAAYGNANNLAVSANAYSGAMANSVNAYTSATYVKLIAGQQTITGDVSIAGNLSLLGSSTVISSNSLSVGDSLIYLAANNYSGTDLLDIGFIANYGNTTAANVHTGLVRDATDKQYYLFNSYDREPANNTFVPGSNNMTNAVLVADFNTSNLTLGGANAITWISSGFGVANAAYGQANTLSTSANAYAASVGSSANAYSAATYSTLTQFGSVFGVANGAFGKANTAYQNGASKLVVGNHTYSSYNPQSALITTDNSAGSMGLLMRDSSNNFGFQLYSDSTNYGFLSGAWTNWDIQKVIGGKLYLNNATTYYLDPASTSRMYQINFNNLYYASDTNFGFIATAVYADTINSGYNSDPLELCYSRGTWCGISHDSLRAPIYYDYNDTAYYCDPNSQSVFSRLNIVGGAVAESNGYPWRYWAPGGGTYSGSGTVTGALKVRLPSGANNSSGMHKIVIDIYEYSTGYSRTIEVGGYNYGGGNWYNYFAYQTTQWGGDLNVRWGYDGTSDCIWIGDTGSTWQYPQVSIRVVSVGYGGGNVDNWRTGWSLSFVTSFDTVEQGPVVCPGTTGQVLQVVQATDNSYTSTSVSAGSTTNWVSATITRKSPVSKILVIFSGRLGQNSTIDTGIRLYSGLDGRLTAAEGAGGANNPMKSIVSIGTDRGQLGSYFMEPANFQYLYTPSGVTSSITLTVQVYSEGAQNLLLNGENWRGSGDQAHSTAAHLVLMEIA